MEKIIEIPDGYEARIKGNKVILEPKESEDEKIRSAMLRGFNSILANQPIETFYGESIRDIIAYLERQKEQKPHWKPSEEQMEALDCAIGMFGYMRMADALRELYANLKKL